jgi:hypothetical protein
MNIVIFVMAAAMIVGLFILVAFELTMQQFGLLSTGLVVAFLVYSVLIVRQRRGDK